MGKHDILGYGKQKVKKLKTSMPNLVASGLDIERNYILSIRKQTKVHKL